MNETFTCRECFGLVEQRMKRSHEKWHEALANDIDAAVEQGIREYDRKRQRAVRGRLRA